ncbi:MAG: DCC1-like thiol-disulfide oxidoreductase family protein [Cyanobacteria bacterium P01_H01_bin.15]
MKLEVIYDGNCNLCVTFTQLLEQFDRGRLFNYVPMQAEATLAGWGITPKDCEKGIILLNAENPAERWQGSDAIEEITRKLPLGAAFIAAYRALPGAKLAGDRVYAQVRDNRYDWFGKRSETYESEYVADCGCGK